MCWISTTTPTTSPSRARRGSDAAAEIASTWAPPLAFASPTARCVLPALRHRRREPAGRPRDRRRCSRDLQIIETDIHTFSGDGLQLDPDREEPGWDNVRVERSSIWLEPLTEDTNGFLAGQVPGENAVDTKTIAGGERANLTIEDSELWGFRDGVDFSNQAALLFKENVNAIVRRTHIHGSEIGLRVRGPSDTRPEGAHVRVVSSVIDDVDVGVRFEDDITRLQLWHITFGSNIGEMFRRVESDLTEVNVLNSLFVEISLLAEAFDAETNATASSDDFVDMDGGDYHLADTSEAIDRGSPITGVTQDMDWERSDRR